MPSSRSRSNQTREKMKVISAICWIPKGAFNNVRFATEPPTKEEINEALKTFVALDESYADSDYSADSDCDDDADMDDIADGDQEDDGVLQAEGVANALSKEKHEDYSSPDYIAAGMSKLNMERYDDDEDQGNGSLYYTSNDMDPYLKNDGADDSEEDEEIEDMTVKPNVLIVAGLHLNKEHLTNYLKVFILEELMDGNLCTGWSNHKIPFAHTPLCLAWSDCSLKDGQKGNFMAVGTMSTGIEIWDLDIVDAIKPHTVLGGKEHEARKLKKVQVVSWSQHSPEIILSGSFDTSVALKDVKNCAPGCIRWSVEADVETVAWDPHNEHLFVILNYSGTHIVKDYYVFQVSLENGMVQAFDKRRSSSNDQSSSLALFTVHAHEKAVTSVSFGPSAPNFLATSSTDKTVKLWDISSNQPSCIASLNPKLGAIFSVSFSNDDPFLLAMGGCKGKIKISNTLALASVANRFGSHGRAKPC
ncbi:putative WD repeat-containing protein C17D11.16 [Dichanthelium oligosanthes]|uniref:Putative WD repeat-containing protein C17D11.16 n=1 Tax=Dichanthelium oligosanthes TaxID=888268 RepID=A0A1E5WF26_9POAL|nr:putative WD repeat-containing protein C17D11.16 [Dichanthelium oligosanthes]